MLRGKKLRLFENIAFSFLCRPEEGVNITRNGLTSFKFDLTSLASLQSVATALTRQFAEDQSAPKKRQFLLPQLFCPFVIGDSFTTDLWGNMVGFRFDLPITLNLVRAG